MSARNRQKGFTLVEIMVATTVSAMITVGLFGFFLTMYKIGFVSQERNQINADMRALTAALMEDGRQSKGFLLYESTRPADRDTRSDRQLDGKTGDLLVFLYSESSGDITRLIGYFRQESDTDSNGLAPVRRFVREFNPPSEQNVEALLPNESSLAQADEVIELSQGFANGRLFFNFRGRSVMVNGQIYHGNEAKRVTETYNLTISPRG